MRETANLKEVTGMAGADYHMQYAGAETVAWTDKRLDRITRLRMLTDRGFPAYDISYCYGELKNGSPVIVDLPFHQLPKTNWKRAIITQAKIDRVYAHGLGLFGAVSILSD